MLALLGSASLLHAQFETTGNEPASLRWRQMETPSFRLIYPTGGDSLATEYARLMEIYRPVVGVSLGMEPGGLQWGKTPVLLHSQAVFSNGAVTWAPKRMDLYTLPDAYGSEALPWTSQLVIHEQRHLAQMQFGYRGWLFKPLTWLFGEMVPGGLAGVYPGQALLEGDAVVAETALTKTGRGRSGDFLTYYQVAYDNGDWRNWYRWRYGSFRDYAPDHYALGYETVAGARIVFGDTLFMQRYFDGVSRHPLRIGRFRHMLKKDSGLSFRAAFREIQESFQADWAADRALRAEEAAFMPMQQWTATPRFATDYGKGVWLDGAFYAVKSGKVTPATLIRIDADGHETRIRPMSTRSGYLQADQMRHRIYWSESITDRRWSLSGTARIRYYSLTDRLVHDLTHEGRLFNPAVSPDGTIVAAVSYPPEGGSAACLLRADNGSITELIPAPDAIQLTEMAWCADNLYALGLGDEGFAIWRRDGVSWTRITDPIPAKMHNLGSADGVLTFISDLGGVNELYSYAPAGGELLRLTHTPYGATDYGMDGGQLVFSAMTPKGMALFRTPADSLQPVPASFSDRHAYLVADLLSAQERALLDSTSFHGMAPETQYTSFHGLSPETQYTSFHGLSVESPRPYRKASHLLHIHSWAPFAFDYDGISGSSGDFVRDEVTPGATILLQNSFGNAYGFANYSYHRDDENDSRWRHSFHGQFTYTGLYPVLQMRLSVGDRDRILYYRQQVDYFGTDRMSTAGFILDNPAVEASFKAYVPLNFSQGGWTRGLLPQLSYTLSNDIFSRERRMLRYRGIFDEKYTLPYFIGTVKEGRNVMMQSLTLSVRGYTYRPAAESQTYPSLGIGAEIGGFYRPGIGDFFSPNLYGYVYGYLPGLFPQQGLRLSCMVQQEFTGDLTIREGHLNLQPRGFGSSVGAYLGRQYGTLVKATADYAIPFSFGDISFLSPLVYVRSFTFTPHADLTWCGGNDNLYSVGADLTAELANLLWFPFDGSFGVALDYNSGTLYQTTLDTEKAGAFTARMIFSLDF